MENKQVSKRGISAWMDDFINALAKKAEINTPKEEGDKEQVVATTNIGDLDKVVWKDETFRVAFDDKGANVINEFGNTVTSIPNAKTVEEVDQKLNANEIVASDEDSEEDLSNELGKLALSLDDEVLEGEEDNVTASVEEEACDMPPIAETKEADVSGDDEVLEGEDDVMNVIASGFEELEATIAALEHRLSSMEQQYARVPQLQDVSTTAPDDEVKHFTEDADASAQEIAKEHNVDLTSPAGRVELSNQQHQQIEQAVNAQPTGQSPALNDTQSVPNGDAEVPVDQNATMLSQQTSPTSAPAVQPVGTEESKADDKTDDKDSKDDVCPGCGKPESECECEDCKDDETNVEKLSGVSEKIFQQGVCPETGEELVKSTTAGHFLGVYSPKGGTEYAVDLRSGEIFKYIK